MQVSLTPPDKPWQRRLRLGLPEILSRLRYRLRRRVARDVAQEDYREWIRRFEANAPVVAPRPHAGWYQLLLPGETVAGLAGLPQFEWDPSAPKALDRLPGELTHAVFLGPGLAPHPHALPHLQAALVPGPVRLAFGDEDRVDASGVRRDPYFKPCWDPELLLEHDYVSGLFAVDRRTLAESMHRPLPPSAARQALILRLARSMHFNATCRIPRVLSHRTAPVGDRGQPLAALQDWAFDESAGSRAGLVAGVSAGRIDWSLPASLPTVSVVIPTRDQPGHLGRCLTSLSALAGQCPLEIVLVDNGTTDPEALALLDAAARAGGVVLRRDEPFNFSRLVNAGAAEATGDLVCLLNNDIQAIEPGWQDRMAALALREDTGAVGAMLAYPDGTIQHAGILAGLGGSAANLFAGLPLTIDGQHGRARCRQQFSAVTAACLMVRREVFTALGGFNVDYPVAFNDVDFCLRLRKAGLRVVWTPDVVLRHFESASRGRDDDGERRQCVLDEVRRLRADWAAELDNDPAYNPNLTLHGDAFDLTLVPRWRAAHEAMALRQDK